MSAVLAPSVVCIDAGSGDERILAAVKNALQLVSVVASPIPVLMLATIVFLRHELTTPTHSLIELTGVSLLILNVGAFGSAKRWIASGPALVWLALLGICVIGFLPASLPAMA